MAAQANRGTLLAAAAGIALVWAVPPLANAATIYYGQEDGVYRADLDGTNVTKVVTALDITTVAFNPLSEKLYYGSVLGTVRRVNLDGSGIENRKN